MPHKHIEVSRTGFQGRPHDDHEHFKIHRLNEGLPTDKSHYLVAAIGELHVGQPVPVHCHGPAVAYIIEGEVHFEDSSKPGEITKLVASDVIHLDQGTSGIYTTSSHAKVFGVSYAPSTHHPEDYVVKN